MEGSRILDDLEEGVSWVELQCGDELVRGEYHGLRRMSISGATRWYIDIRDRPLGLEDVLVQTRDVEKILRIRRVKG